MTQSTKSAILASQVDGAVALALSRVTLEVLRGLSPEIEQAVVAKLSDEIARLRLESELHDDGVAEAAAAVLSQIKAG